MPTRSNCFEPLVSVITPMYNCAAFLGDTIRSVQAQTYQNWELLLIDDCSADRSADIADAFAAADSRIRVIRLEQNSGAAAARNAGLARAGGRYLAFLDGDDMWAPEKLQRQVSFMQLHNVAFSYTGYELMDEAGAPLATRIVPPAAVCYEELAGNTIIGCLTVMLDSRKLGTIRMPEVKPEDTALWLQLLRRGLTAYGLPEVLARYRIVPGSVSRNKWKAARAYWHLLRSQERLGFLQTSSYFLKYALHAYMKNRKGTTT